MSKIKVTFLPQKKSILVPEGISIKDAAKFAEIVIDSPCGGIGKCGKCKVEVTFRNISRKQHKLACRTKITEEMTVTIPDSINVDLKKLFISASPIKNKTSNSGILGVAIDVGTTSIVGVLVDLVSKNTLSVAAEVNPQYVHGADVISRIDFSINNVDGTKKLQGQIVGAVNRIIAKLSKDTTIKSKKIQKITITGNTTMQHLFMGIDTKSLAFAPYQPPVKGIYNSITASQIGININDDAQVYFIPNISGWIGGDTLSMISALGFYKSDKIKLAIDIGTNGEIVLGSKKRILVASTAAGPCFEGANISSGMRAASGAIESVYFTDESIFYNVIDNVPAKGLCGSGLIDIIAELLRYEIIDETGRIKNIRELKDKLPSALLESIVENKEGNKVLVAKNDEQSIFVTQQDIRELQLGKAAISAGIQMLTMEMGIKIKEIDEILLAGTFGNYIDKTNAQRIGLIPSVSLKKVKYVGNAACEGARLALISQEVRDEMEEKIKTIEHIDLISKIDFQQTFVDAIYFPK